MAKPRSAGSTDLAEVTRRLDAIVGLLACSLRGESDATEIMRVLSTAGLSYSEISQHFGCTPNAVKVALYKSRKSKG